jgi:tRNA A-37 threonylcarbamoyl transferase component Bud32/tetratricopeptide (TPR) repeat protein
MTSINDDDIAAPSAPQALRDALAGRVTVEGEVGRGGMAIVYRGQDVRHQRVVAIKVLRSELAVAVGAERFLREIRIEASLNHPNILTLIDSGQAGHLLYYLTPWAEGGTLRDRLNREPQMPLDAALQITREVGDALSHAHRAGVVHRDVKPENILFRSGHALLADFGIAHAVADTALDILTESGLAVGTPTYMSPEQAMPGGMVDHRADQYSLACILFEMLAGDPPFTGRSTQAVLARHMTERPPSLSIVRPDIPPSVAGAIARALEKTPAARYATMDQFVAALHEPSSAALARQHHGTRKRWVGATVIAAAGVLAATFLWTRDEMPLSPGKVAVFPLATRGLPAADSGAGVGVAYLIEAALERADPLQLIDITGRLSPDQIAGPERISDRAARRIARQVGAAFSLRGVVLGHRDSTTVTLRLYSVAGDSQIVQQSATGESRSTPLHHIGLDALRPLLPSLIDPTREIDMSGLRERRAQAIALWMQGERHYRLSQFELAGQYYARALADDSLLAIAAIKGAQAASWLHERPRAVSLVRQALALSGQLPQKYAALARGLGAQYRGDADSAVIHLRHARSLDPTWAEASAALGEVFTHMLPTEGSLDSIARESFHLALERDSGFTSPVYHLAEEALRDGRVAEATQLMDRLRRAGAEPTLLRQLTLMRECVLSPSAKPWEISSPAAVPGVFAAAKSLSGGARQPACAEGGLRAILASPGFTDTERWGAFLVLQGLSVARRDDRQAIGLVDSIVKAGRGAARTLYVLGAIAGARMSAEADSLLSWAGTRYGDHYQSNTNPEALWVLLSWHRERGDTAHVRFIADTLEARAATSGDPRTRQFAYAARAQMLLAIGDTARAIAALSALHGPADTQALTWSFGEAFPVERLLLARLLLSQGRHGDAIAVASRFDHPEPITFLAFVGESLGLRYRAALALGNRRLADSFRQRLVELGRQDLIDAASPTRR